MKENKELERADIAIDREMEVDCDIGQEITVYIETWFDVDKKFGLHTHDEDGTWLNLYGKYNPFADTLRLECEISRDDGSDYFDYEPTEEETKLIKDMIAEKIREQWDQTPQEFCKSAFRQDEEVYVYQNRMRCSIEQLLAQRKRTKEYMDEHGYVLGGRISSGYPLNWDDKEYRHMLCYCQSHGITKVIADSYRDLAARPDEAHAMIQKLQNDGLTVEFSDSRFSRLWKEYEAELSEEANEEDMTMGGLT